MTRMTRYVPEPTRLELAIAYLLMYVKLPLSFYPFYYAARLVCEESHDIFYFLQWGALTLVAAVLPVVATVWLPIGFTQRIRGRMTKARFRVLRIVSLWMILGSILSLVNQVFLKGVLNTPIRILMMPIVPMTQGATAIVVSIVMLIGGMFIWSGTTDIRKERCPYCGGYDYLVSKTVPGTYQQEQIGGKTVTTSEVTFRDVEPSQYGGGRVTDYIKETTTTTGTYAYKGKSHKTCRYCSWDFGISDYSGTFTTEDRSTSTHHDTRYY